jgi:hypothetical protein
MAELRTPLAEGPHTPLRVRPHALRDTYRVFSRESYCLVCASALTRSVPPPPWRANNATLIIRLPGQSYQGDLRLPSAPGSEGKFQRTFAEVDIETSIPGTDNLLPGHAAPIQATEATILARYQMIGPDVAPGTDRMASSGGPDLRLGRHQPKFGTELIGGRPPSRSKGPP